MTVKIIFDTALPKSPHTSVSAPRASASSSDESYILSNPSLTSCAIFVCRFNAACARLCLSMISLHLSTLPCAAAAFFCVPLRISCKSSLDSPYNANWSAVRLAVLADSSPSLSFNAITVCKSSIIAFRESSSVCESIKFSSAVSISIPSAFSLRDS